MNDTSRRTLLRAGGLGAIVAPFVPSWFASAEAAGTLYSRRRFALRKGQTFRLVGEGRSHRVTLRQVRGDEQNFTVTFRSALGGPEQGTYSLRRRGFATTTLFVVPSDSRRTTHQAVVNRAR